MHMIKRDKKISERDDRPRHLIYETLYYIGRNITIHIYVCVCVFSSLIISFSISYSFDMMDFLCIIIHKMRNNNAETERAGE